MLSCFALQYFTHSFVSHVNALYSAGVFERSKDFHGSGGLRTAGGFETRLKAVAEQVDLL